MHNFYDKKQMERETVVAIKDVTKERSGIFVARRETCPMVIEGIANQQKRLANLKPGYFASAS